MNGTKVIFMIDNFANEDFDRAYRRGFWRKLSAWLTGRSNELLPYEEVRRQLPFQGQRDIGRQEVPLDKIVGSVGRYRDFDRVFLPTQKFTAQRWINISKARYKDVELPPIEAYKIGEVYFVKDGNHRVSVARERNQLFIDAYVTEIDAPIPLTPDMELDDLVAKKDYAKFMKKTNLNKLRPNADLELAFFHEYGRLLEHIETHRYYLSLESHYQVPFETATTSWYDTIYLPLVQAIKAQNLPKQFPDYTLTDLYLVVSEYQWLLREELEGKDSLQATAENLMQIYNEKEVRHVLSYLRRANWISQMILEQDRSNFMEKTQLNLLRPESDIVLSLPGKYENLLGHINTHHYYMGEERQADVPFEEAVASFYDNVYAPLLDAIREQGIIKDFANRTEADLCLWVLDHRHEFDETVDQLPQIED